MGICQSSFDIKNDKKSLEVHRNIENELKRDLERGKTIIKLLLLGPGESGKSTVLKQMRIIHCNGFSDDEIYNRRWAVFANTLESMLMLLEGVDFLGINLIPERKADADRVRSYKSQIDCQTALPQDVYMAIKRLWQDEVIRDCYDRKSEFQINDSADYFFNCIDRIREVNYVPNIQDILMTRVPTSGVTEICYEYKKITFRIFDVGGQKSERRKWIHCFDNVDAILFIVAISEYDQYLREDNKTNRLIDALALFENVVNNQFFTNAQVILFMNKKDLFMEKSRRVPLTKAFPKYKGEQDYESMTKFINKVFMKLSKDKEKTIYSHLTCATDTNQVQLVLSNATDMIISHNFKQTGVA